MKLTKKQQKEWLLTQIKLAKENEPGEYRVANGKHIFELPGLTYFAINTTPDAEEFKNSRLDKFASHINKSPAFKETRKPVKL